MITQEKIDRINALARKAKTPEGLTAEETAERAALPHRPVRLGALPVVY